MAEHSHPTQKSWAWMLQEPASGTATQSCQLPLCHHSTWRKQEQHHINFSDQIIYVPPQYLQTTEHHLEFRSKTKPVSPQYLESAETLFSVQWLGKARHHSTWGQQEHCLVFSDWTKILSPKCLKSAGITSYSFCAKHEFLFSYL
jgi:hypothetical protein